MSDEIVALSRQGKPIKLCVRCGARIMRRGSVGKYCTDKCFRSVPGLSTHEFYPTWRGMMWRCYRPKDSAYKRYGAIGITVCHEWHDFLTFEAWALAQPREPGMTLDRIKNHLGYSPDNCKFSTLKEQQRNRAVTIFLGAFGEIKPLREWIEDPRCVVNKNTFIARVKTGIIPEMALTTPPTKGRTSIFKRTVGALLRMNKNPETSVTVNQGSPVFGVRPQSEKISKACLNCQVEFEPYAPHLKYCSRDCYRAMDRDSHHEFFPTWRAMIARCHDHRDPHFNGYGGRGIFVCEEWRKFQVFESWVLTQTREPGMTVERIDNNLGYTPENCKFATRIEQQRNRRNTRFIAAFGETKPQTAWAEDYRCMVSKNILIDRLRRGFTPEEAISTLPFDEPLWPTGSDQARLPRCKS